MNTQTKKSFGARFLGWWGDVEKREQVALVVNIVVGFVSAVLLLWMQNSPTPTNGIVVPIGFVLFSAVLVMSWPRQAKNISLFYRTLVLVLSISAGFAFGILYFR